MPPRRLFFFSSSAQRLSDSGQRSALALDSNVNQPVDVRHSHTPVDQASLHLALRFYGQSAVRHQLYVVNSWKNDTKKERLEIKYETLKRWMCHLRLTHVTGRTSSMFPVNWRQMFTQVRGVLWVIGLMHFIGFFFFFFNDIPAGSAGISVVNKSAF